MRLLIALALLAAADVAAATDWGTPPDSLVDARPKGCDASADAGTWPLRRACLREAPMRI